MKHETEINEMINTAFPKQCWMTDEEHQEIIEETFKQMGINKEKLSDDIEIGIKNGYTVKQQINLLKWNILLLPTFKITEQAFAIHSVSERTFIVEEKIAGSCYWESLSVEFDNLEEAKCFFNRRYEKYSENIRLVEVYAR